MSTWRPAVAAGLTALAVVFAGGGAPTASATSPFALLASTGALRANAYPLDGLVVHGPLYAFVRPEVGVGSVRFYIDDPGMSGAPTYTDKVLPFDLGGSSGSAAALPFQTGSLADGAHTLTAAASLTAGGTQLVTASFKVANRQPALQLPDQTVLGAQLGGSPVSTRAAVTSSDGSSVPLSATSSQSWLSASLAAGATPDTLTLNADPTGLAAGAYTAMVTVTTTAGEATATLPVTLYVEPSLVPDQVPLSWTGDPATTLTVMWHTWDPATPANVECRESGQSSWQTASGSAQASGADGGLHVATLTGLAPATAYDYRVQRDGGGWGDVYTTRTAPAVAGTPLDLVYVGDTGVIGRPDGLAAGTRDVLDAVQALHPNLLLLAGDFVSRDTDTRFPDSVDPGIDAWFAQMQPLLSSTPGMPTWGNHEVQVGQTCCREGYAPWAARFSTPQGSGGSQNYSFDVAGVHFVEVFASSTNGGLSSTAMTWLKANLAAAHKAKHTWIIPFLHVTAFSDGANHPSNLKLRKQLGPVFQKYGVKLVLQAHDQAYERTWPLVGVPATDTPTSSALGCYTMADGTTWTTTSPGGKLSDQNENFSQWLHTTPPSWEAVRDNTMFHYAEIHVTGTDLQFTEYGIPPGGGPPVVTDTFRYTTGSC